MFSFTKEEVAVLKKLSTPGKIQDFLDTLPFNFEKGGETYMSPRRVLQTKTAHCFEGALLAAAALWYHGSEPLLLDLQTLAPDQDHVVALYKTDGLWGAISKTNHGVLRFRDPIYKNMRELALSYFHEYFLNKNGVKTLYSYSRPFNLKRFGKDWLTAEQDLWPIVHQLDDSPHTRLFPKKTAKILRPASRVERQAGQIVEWPKS